MLKEFERLRQDKLGFRRLFENEQFNLYVWYDHEGGEITGFQLVYFEGDEQKALTWTADGGYSHMAVDGWDSVRFNKSPLLVADGVFARQQVMGGLESELLALEAPIGQLVLEKIRAYTP